MCISTKECDLRFGQFSIIIYNKKKLSYSIGLMSMQIEMGIVEKRKNRNQPNIYCLFGTKQSFETFH